MDFAQVAPSPQRTAIRLTVVVLLHAALIIGLVHGMKTTKFSVPKIDEIFLVATPEIKPPPPPPPKPPEQKQTPKQPDLIVPKVEVAVAPPPEPVLSAKVADDTPVAPSEPGPSGPPSNADAAPNEGMNTAVMADANACKIPPYPAAATRNGEEGTTKLALLVAADGHVSDARVEKSSGSRELDKAARQALSLCQFKPATKNGVPGQAWGAISYVWKLD